MNPTHEIYFEADNDVIGTAYYLPDGDISISLNNGHFAGIFNAFENWNPGGYAIRAIGERPPIGFIAQELEELDFDLEDDWLNDLDQQRLMDNKPSINFDEDDWDWEDDDGVITRSNNIDDTCNYIDGVKTDLSTFTGSTIPDNYEVSIVKESTDESCKLNQFYLPENPQYGDKLNLLGSGPSRGMIVYPGNEMIQGQEVENLVLNNYVFLSLAYLGKEEGWVIQ